MMNLRPPSSLKRLGMPGVLGIGVLLGCAAFNHAWLRPAEHELDARLAAGAKVVRAPGPVSAEEDAAQLGRFHALFPPIVALPEEVEKLHRLARLAGLTLLKAEYRLESRDAELVPYRVVVPLRAHYGQVRRFIDLLLKELPTASIDGLRFRRSKSAESQVEAELQLTLYFHQRVEAPQL